MLQRIHILVMAISAMSFMGMLATQGCTSVKGSFVPLTSDKFTPKKDILMLTGDATQPYKEIGMIEVTGNPTAEERGELGKKMRELGLQAGADAIIKIECDSVPGSVAPVGSLFIRTKMVECQGIAIRFLEKDQTHTKEIHIKESKDIETDLARVQIPNVLKVVKSSICRGIKNRQPVSPDTSFDVTDCPMFVYCFTQIEGAERDQKIVHIWYHDGKEVCRVRLNAWGPRSSTWSWKLITTHMVGDWKVEVATPGGEILDFLSFRVNGKIPEAR